MKVIFLDFNGVLDTNEEMDVINIDNLYRLKRIVDETGSVVVISSSLKDYYYYTGKYSKMLEYLISTLESVGIDVIGLTPKLRTREEEINSYLMNHLDIDGYVILDDDYEMESLSDHLVKLDNQIIPGQVGLEDKHVDKAISILNKTKSLNLK